MGPWRALLNTSRGRSRYLSPPATVSSSYFSSSSHSGVDQKQLVAPWLFSPIAKQEAHFQEIHHTGSKERKWPVLGLGGCSAQEKFWSNGGALPCDLKKDSSAVALCQTFSQKTAWLNVGASPEKLKESLSGLALLAESSAEEISWLNAPDDLKESLLDILKHCSPNHVKGDLSLLNGSIRVPGFYGLEDLTLEADSVKRKRKKKMNKHKHRKLRRLTRKSSK